MDTNHTNFARAWGAVVPVHIGPLNVAAGQALTTGIAELFAAPASASIADIVFNITASGTGGNHEVDIYNALTGGSSWLTGPIVIPSGVATSTRYSANELGLLPSIYDKSLSDLSVWYANLVNGGNIFSLRASTPASTGSLTNLYATVLLCPYQYEGP